jgi:hypothetical protein
VNLFTSKTRRFAALTALLLVAAAAVAGAWAPQPGTTDRNTTVEQPVPAHKQVQFLAYDIVIDSGAEPLSVYQVEIKDRKGHARIVGIEGGEPGAYNEAPYYDPKAIQGDHVIIGAFTTADAPTGKVRVARVHVMAEGGTPDFTTAITTAAQGGRKFNATLTVQPAAKP